MAWYLLAMNIWEIQATYYKTVSSNKPKRINQADRKVS